MAELVADREAPPRRPLLRLVGVDPDLAAARQQQPRDRLIAVEPRAARRRGHVVDVADQQAAVAVGDVLDRDRQRAPVPDPSRDLGEKLLGAVGDPLHGAILASPRAAAAVGQPSRKRASISSRAAGAGAISSASASSAAPRRTRRPAIAVRANAACGPPGAASVRAPAARSRSAPVSRIVASASMTFAATPLAGKLAVLHPVVVVADLRDLGPGVEAERAGKPLDQLLTLDLRPVAEVGQKLLPGDVHALPATRRRDRRRAAPASPRTPRGPSFRGGAVMR